MATSPIDELSRVRGSGYRDERGRRAKADGGHVSEPLRYLWRYASEAWSEDSFALLPT